MRTLQQRIIKHNQPVGTAPQWTDFPEGVMAAIMQGMKTCRFEDHDGNVYEYRWKSTNGAPIQIVDDPRRS